MKLSQMAVQGLQQFKSPLLQLPHIEEDNLRRVSNHKKVIWHFNISFKPFVMSLKGNMNENFSRSGYMNILDLQCFRHSKTMPQVILLTLS